MPVINDYTKEQLFQLAFHDKMTGTYNRNVLEEARAHYDDSIVWVSIVDVDNLKQINDTQGHAAGDALIISVANQLKAFSPDAIRLGGDEFLIISEQQPPISIEGATIGSVQKFPMATLAEAMHYADLVMYYNKEEKKHGKNISNKPRKVITRSVV